VAYLTNKRGQLGDRGRGRAAAPLPRTSNHFAENFMTTSLNDNLNDWLRDAHAMEEQADKMLNAQAERLEHYPDLRARIVQHIEETRWQTSMLEECLSRRGISNSTLKDLGGKLMAFGQAVGGMTVSDEVVKGAMAGYVFENIEIATYTTLIAAATAAGDTATQSACEQILVQEKAMAAWLLEHLPQVTLAFLERAATPGATAKV
jgi:ferritin-like metal-binding protein YciE